MLVKKLIDSISFQHAEHKDWMSKLNFYQDEIKFFQHEMSIVLSKHTNSFSIIEHVDEYREIFLKKLKMIDDLRHEIMLHESRLSQVINPEVDMMNTHDFVRKNFEQLETDMERLKTNFRKFASRND